ncbi:MAG TPA: hypothetical protein VMV48_05675 [Gallionellaceae bacterium]|nr:hypothetical protein [Gallionellaceae bacterium]
MVLAIGFLSLALILYIVVYLNLPQSSHNKQQENKQPAEIFSKKIGEMQLGILRDEINDGQLLMNISRGAQQLVSNYAFPAKEYDLYWANVSDAKIITLQNGEHGVIVFTASEECDHCDNGKQIWIFKLGKNLNLLKMISLFDLHQTVDNSNHYFANKLLNVPYQEGLQGDQIFIPIEIMFGKEIIITPMLTLRSIGFLKGHWGKFIENRTQKPSGTENDDLSTKLKMLPKELNEAFARQVISY